MENPYIHQYPDLMAGRKIMYVHGFMSSAQSGTVKLIRDSLPEAEVVAYDLPLHPAEAMELLHNKCETDKPDLIIGTSMGGMYTEMLYGFDRICVNPAFEMGETMRENGMIGHQTFMNPRADGVQDFIVTKALVKEYRDTTLECFKGASEDEQSRVFGLFGDNDPVVHTYDVFRSHYRQAIRFHGEHRMDDKVFIDSVVPVIRWISDRQSHLERPVVAVDYSTLMDAYGKPKASLHKAYTWLTEHYNVIVTAPAPTDDHDFIPRTQEWIEQYLSVPAFNRVVFVNQPQLLCADYMVSCNDVDGFMGTLIKLGSDEFKTWEEIIVYFERLGGQDR